MDAMLKDDAFTNFLRDVDPRVVEVERFGRPTDSERPGSVADKQMRRNHERHKLELASQREDEQAYARRLQLVQAAQELERRHRGTPQQEQDIAAYAARKHERKAS